MAIHGDLEGIEVTICIDGKPVTEYETDNDEIKHNDPVVVIHQANMTVTNYIEATTNKEFTIKIQVQSPYKIDCPRLGFYTTVDGELVLSPSMKKQIFEQGKHSWSSSILGFAEGTPGEMGIIKKFRFSKINTSLCYLECTGSLLND